jgi:hypothetical protein
VALHYLVEKINLDWKNLKWINKISVSGNTSENLDLLLKEYSNVFSDGIGCVAEIKAKLTLKENATPKFVKVSNHQLISLRFSTKFVFFRAYLVILS